MNLVGTLERCRITKRPRIKTLSTKITSISWSSKMAGSTEGGRVGLTYEADENGVTVHYHSEMDGETLQKLVDIWNGHHDAPSKRVSNVVPFRTAA